MTIDHRNITDRASDVNCNLCEAIGYMGFEECEECDYDVCPACHDKHRHGHKLREIEGYFKGNTYEKRYVLDRYVVEVPLGL